MVKASLSHPLRSTTAVPPDEYLVAIIGGTRWSDDASFGVKVLEGRFHGRTVRNWLSKNAKREARSLGITSAVDLSGVCCLVRLALATESDGSQHNVVTRFQVLGREPDGLDKFMPYWN